MITLTESAVSAVQRFIASSDKAIVGLRIKVEGGGCSGYKYGMKLEESIAAGDEVVDLPGLTLLVDQDSASKLIGVTVDYLDGLDGSGFKFENPNASESCSCGKSFN